MHLSSGKSLMNLKAVIIAGFFNSEDVIKTALPDSGLSFF